MHLSMLMSNTKTKGKKHDRQGNCVLDLIGVKCVWIYPREENRDQKLAVVQFQSTDYSGFTPGKLRSNSSSDPSCYQQMTSVSQNKAASSIKTRPLQCNHVYSKVSPIALNGAYSMGLQPLFIIRARMVR